jgi:hypothetical protein
MGRKKRAEAVAVDGAAMETKRAITGTKGGIGASVYTIEQTALNLSQEEIDRLSAQYRDLLNGLVKVVRLKVHSLLTDPRVRDKAHLREVSDAVVSFQQIYQALAGYTTKTAKVEVDLVHEELERIREDRRLLSEEIDRIMAKLKGVRDENEKVLDIGAEEVPALALPGEDEARQRVPLDSLAEDVVLKARLRDALLRGYITLEGTPGPTPAPRVSQKWLGGVVKAVQDSGGVKAEHLAILQLRQDGGKFVDLREVPDTPGTESVEHFDAESMEVAG